MGAAARGAGVNPGPALPTYPSSIQSPKILIVAGEASGDGHAALVVAALKEIIPQAEFVGTGEAGRDALNLAMDIMAAMKTAKV